MRANRLLAAAAALFIAALPARADRILGQQRIDNSGNLGPLGGPTLGTVRDNVFTPNLPAGLLGPTRAGIASAFIPPSVGSIVVSGYASSGDRGAGCTFVRGTSTGPSAIQDALGAYWQLPFGKPYDVTCFGAKMDPNNVDDSAAVQAAVTAGGQVTIPRGGLKFCNVNIPNNVRITGAGMNATAVYAASQTCTPFVANFGTDLSTGGGNITISDLSFYAFGGGRQTGGAFVYLSNCSDCRLTAFKMSGAYIGAQVTGANTVNVSIDHGRSDGAVLYHFYVAGGSDTYLDTLVTTAGGLSQATCGLGVVQTAGAWVSNADFVGSGHGTCLSPGDGQSVKWLFFTNSALGDTGSGNGLFINPTGTGIVQGVSISNSWTASNTKAGVATQCVTSGGNTGSVDGLRISNHRSIDNGGDGFAFGCGRDIRLIAPVAQSNSNPAHGGTSGVSSGVSFSPGVSKFSVANGDFTQMAGDFVLQKYGILVQSGASDYYIITGNDGSGGAQTGKTVQDNGTGTNKIVSGNL